MRPAAIPPACPLCHQRTAEFFFKDKQRAYLRCDGCQLVFVPEPYWLSLADERAIYDLHQNDAGDPGYRKFLARLSAPLLAKLGPNQEGLDFGCGPGPTLSRMLETEGHGMDLYDPFYHHDTAVFSKTYDFICATEVVEHLREPAQVLDLLFRLLRPGGWLGIMTKLVIDREAFRRWHYIRDLTHICFFSRETFAYLGRRFDAGAEFAGKDVILLRKRS